MTQMGFDRYSILQKCLQENLGLYFSDSQEKELRNKLAAAAGSFDFDDVDIFISWLINKSLDSKQIQTLASFLTIGETYFFREKKALRFLEYKFLPDLINERKASKKYLRIWSAGCASGEEPYTISILLQQLIPDIDEWDINIMATDINPSFIQKAKKGIYSKWSFRGSSDSFTANYFKEIEVGKFQINPELQKRVRFSFLNLASDAYPSANSATTAPDIILCRNVLIYFSPDGIRDVTDKFYQSLSENGVLLVSPVETSSLVCSKFHNLSFEGITIYKKDSKKSTKQPFELNTFRNRSELKIPQKLSDLNQNKKIFIKPDKGLQFKSGEFAKPRELVKKNTKGVSPSYLDYAKIFALYQAGEFDEVEKSIAGSKNIRDNDASKLKVLLARIKANQGYLEDSERLIHEAIAMDKVNAEAHYLLASVLSEQGRGKEAIASLNSSLFLDPDFALAYFLLGNISLKNKNVSEGKKYFKNASKILEKMEANKLLAESDGLTAGRLLEIIHSIN